MSGPGCPHLAGAFANPAEGAGLMDRFSSVVQWKLHRHQSVSYPSKRRKVSHSCAVSLAAFKLTFLVPRYRLHHAEFVKSHYLGHMPVYTVIFPDAGKTVMSSSTCKIRGMTFVSNPFHLSRHVPVPFYTEPYGGFGLEFYRRMLMCMIHRCRCQNWKRFLRSVR